MITIKDVNKVYFDDNNIEVKALKNVNLKFKGQGFYCINGVSGSGKTTLLNILAHLEKPSTGKVTLDGKDINIIEMIKYHTKVVSFVYQDLNLIYDLSLVDNLKLIGINDDNLIDEYLTRFSLLNKKYTKVRFLSGGEKQRLAIIRAMISNTKIILLDEPTSDLDIELTKLIFENLAVLSKNKLVIMVTHDIDNALIYADYIIKIKQGEIFKIEYLKDYNLSLEIDDYLNDTVVDLYNKIKIIKYTKMYITNEKMGISKYVLDDNFDFSILTKILFTFNKSKIKINLIKEDETNFDTNQTVAPLEKRFFKTSLKLFSGYVKNRPVHFSIIALLYFISLLILLIFSNVIFFDKNEVLRQSSFGEYYSYYPIYQEVESDYSGENKNIFKGKKLLDNIDKEFEIFPLKSALIYTQNVKIKVIQPTIVLFKSIDFLKDQYPHLNNTDDIIITNHLLDLSYSHEDDDRLILDILIQSDMFGNNDIALDVNNVIYVEDSSFRMSDFLNNDRYYFDNNEKFKYKTGLIYMSYDYYLNYINDLNSIQFQGNNIFLQNSNYQIYFSNQNKLIYKRYENETILEGTNINGVDEIIVSDITFNKYFSEDILPITIDIRNYDDSPNAVLYQEFINLFKHVEKIKIVGIVAESQNLLISNELYGLILEDMIYYDIEEYGIKLNKDYSKYTILEDNNVTLRLKSLIPIYQYDQFKQESLFTMLIWFEISLLILAITIQSNSILNVIKSKRKDIGIFKSLGYSNFWILFPYLVYNYTQAISALVLTFIVGAIFNETVNTILHNDFQFHYNLLMMYPLSILIILITTLTIPIISMTIAFLEIRNTDISILITKSI